MRSHGADAAVATAAACIYCHNDSSEYCHLIRPRFDACGAQEPEPHNADSMGSKGSSATYMARDDTVPEKCLANP